MNRAAALFAATALILPTHTDLGRATEYRGIERLPLYGPRAARPRDCDTRDMNEMRTAKHSDLLAARSEEAKALREKMAKMEENTLERLLAEERLQALESLIALNRKLLEESKGARQKVDVICDYEGGERM